MTRVTKIVRYLAFIVNQSVTCAVDKVLIAQLYTQCGSIFKFRDKNQIK